MNTSYTAIMMNTTTPIIINYPAVDITTSRYHFRANETPATPAPAGTPKTLPISLPIDMAAQYHPLYVLTAIFGVVFIIAPLLVRKGPNQSVMRCSIMTSCFCMWLLWVTIYIAQMNPLMGPVIKNDSFIWMKFVA